MLLCYFLKINIIDQPSLNQSNGAFEFSQYLNALAANQNLLSSIPSVSSIDPKTLLGLSIPQPGFVDQSSSPETVQSFSDVLAILGQCLNNNSNTSTSSTTIISDANINQNFSNLTDKIVSSISFFL